MKKDELIQKWLKGELTPQEQKDFDSLEEASFFEEIIEEGQRFKANKHTKVSSFNNLENRITLKKKHLPTHWLSILSKVAAVLLISLGVFYLFNSNVEATFQTHYAESTTITLPDNSVVELNELSNLAYKTKNWDKNRTLQLKGEAFFNVEKGMRFDVKTSNGIVSVLGTEFNVLDRDSIFKVSCYEGLVQVDYNNKTTKLPAGKELIIRNGLEQHTKTALAKPTWLKNMSVFNNAYFTEVITELEKQYNTKIQLNLKNNRLKFTGAYTNNNLESALKSIVHPFNLKYEIKSKQQVIIWDELQ